MIMSRNLKNRIDIINQSIHTTINCEEQAGFVPDCRTREQILNIRQIKEKARKYNKPVFLCFIDYEKAFDNSKWSILWKNMQALGVSKNLIELPNSQYREGQAHLV